MRPTHLPFPSHAWSQEKRKPRKKKNIPLYPCRYTVERRQKATTRDASCIRTRTHTNLSGKTNLYIELSVEKNYLSVDTSQDLRVSQCERLHLSVYLFVSLCAMRDTRNEFFLRTFGGHDVIYPSPSVFLFSSCVCTLEGEKH